MKPKDTISVLVCVHSVTDENDRLLCRALESLSRQTYSDFETIVVMDECHNATRGVVNRYKDILNLRVLERPRKQGLAKAKNYGIKHCSGDWIAFLDADDTYMDCKLEVQRNYMLKNSAIKFCRQNLGTENSKLRSLRQTALRLDNIKHILRFQEDYRTRTLCVMVA